MSDRRILLVGYGSIGQGLTPLLFHHLDIEPKSVAIITADSRGSNVAAQYGIQFNINPLTPENYSQVLPNFLSGGDLLINVSVDVSSVALIEWCQDHGVLYTDTCVEPWAGGYQEGMTNYQLREEALSFHSIDKTILLPTALIAHGANPGLVSHLVHSGLRSLAGELGFKPQGSSGELARLLGVRTIQIAERDTQTDNSPLLKGEFSNTWSVDGLLSEALQHNEMGWGTHEILPPNNGSLQTDLSAVLNQSSVDTKVQSWVPSRGAKEAYLITHHESIAITDHLSVYGDNHELVYRPTVFYAYSPSPKTIESLEEWKASGYLQPSIKTVMGNQIQSGFDELGVLFVFPGGSYWYGSTLDCTIAREMVPYNNATTLQVTATMIGGIKWILDNPNMGVIEAEDIDADEILSVSLPYIGKVHGVMTTWQPHGSYSLQFDDFLVRNNDEQND